MTISSSAEDELDLGAVDAVHEGVGEVVDRCRGRRRISRTRRTNSSKNILISSRASAAPRQKWVPKPNAMWWFGVRVTS